MDTFHPEGDAPVGGDPDAPEPFHVAFEWMEPVAGEVKVRGVGCCLEGGDHSGDPIGVGCVHLVVATGLVRPSESPVAVALDRRTIVACNKTSNITRSRAFGCVSPPPRSARAC